MLKTRDHFLTQETFYLKTTEYPGILRTEPVPEDIWKYYESENYFSHQENATSYNGKVYNSIRTVNLRLKLNLLNKLKTKEKKLLDYGCGTGNLITYLNKNKWHSEGYEPNKNASKILEKKGILNIAKNSENTEYQYDVITLWHVLEHIEEPKIVLQDLIPKIKCGGYIILALPNYKSWDASYYKAYWAGYDTPRHLWHYSPGGLKSYMQSYDLKFIKQKIQPFDAYYVSLLSERYKKNKLPILNALIKGTLSNIAALFTKQGSSNIYIFQKL